METIEDSNALVVVGAGGKANVVEETTKGKLTKLPLSVLKDFEAVAALTAGEGQHGAVTGVELVKQVGGISAAQHRFQTLVVMCVRMLLRADLAHHFRQHCTAVRCSPLS